MRCLFLILNFILGNCLQAQELWYVSHTDAKYLSVNQVLTNLHHASRDSSRLPNLEIEKKGMNPPQNAPVAYYNAFLEEIVIEAEMLDLCRSYQKDSTIALAFVLGHELGHHHLGHSGGFCAFKLHSYTKEDSLSLQYEIDADKMGNFYARLAGYSPCELGVKLIEPIYTTFSIPNKPNYPSQNYRIELLQKNCQSADTLAHLFVVAQHFSENKLYESSIKLFHHLLTHFPTKEMYFNAAIPCLQWIVNEGFDTSDSLYQIPLLYEPNIHFRASMSPAAMRLHFKKRSMYLKEAKQYLEIALKIDGNYTLAKLYLAYIIYLEGKITGNLVEDIITDKLKQNAYFSEYEQQLYEMLWGIQLAIEGKKKEAQHYFEKLPATACRHYNLALLNKQALPISDKKPEKKATFPLESKGILLFEQREMRIELVVIAGKNRYYVKSTGGEWYF